MTSPTAPVERVVYQAALESLTRAVEADQKPALITELRERCGYDLHRPRLTYPPTILPQVITLLAERCFPELILKEALRALGHQGFTAYRTTMVGRVVLASLQTATLPRALKLFSQGIATATNFTTYTVTPVDAQTVIFRAHDTYSPPYYVLGMIEGLLEGCGQMEVTVTLIRDNAPYEVDYELHGAVAGIA